MALFLINKTICNSLAHMRLDHHAMQVRNRTFLSKPKLRFPKWFVHKERVIHDDFVTQENNSFIDEIINDQYKKTKNSEGNNSSGTPLDLTTVDSGTWTPYTRRTGIIVKKIGDYPMWTKDGKKILTSLLQVVDNHVVKYIPPRDFQPVMETLNIKRLKNKVGSLLVGSETIDPTLITKEYYGLFKDSGVLPKKHLCRFLVSPEAALPPGTPLHASHFKVGDYVDVRGKTIDRGFQGVMKRWGFAGMPASHGVTKTHRRPGNIGGGGEKARVWPGKKMPGHMGNRWRTIRGVQIVRMNTKLNVMWVRGVAVPGGTGSYCYMYDTVLPLRRATTKPAFPTHEPTGDEEEEIFHQSIHSFNEPTITYPE